MYKIGELSKLCNISVKALRYYDSEGILCPEKIDAFTGYRYYSAAQLSDCYRILALKELGFSLDEIRAGQKLPIQELAGLLADRADCRQALDTLKELLTPEICGNNRTPPFPMTPCSGALRSSCRMARCSTPSAISRT